MWLFTTLLSVTSFVFGLDIFYTYYEIIAYYEHTIKYTNDYSKSYSVLHS